MATRSVQQRDLPAAPLLVLIVDSDDDTRALYRETLSLTGWNVVEGLDGRDALAKALMHPPNLVVTELFLPFIDGFALCEILRRDRRTASIRILVVTGESRPDQLSRAQNFADGVLVKPSTPQMLVNEITRLTSPGYERREHAASTSGNAGDAAQSRRQTALSKAHSRITTSSPPTVPLTLTCPSCDRSLVYVQSHLGGVSERHCERWDYFVCSTCGAFQYRHRTRKLRALHNDEVDWIRESNKRR